MLAVYVSLAIGTEDDMIRAHRVEPPESFIVYVLSSWLTKLENTHKRKERKKERTISIECNVL